ncbi:hypothetical protein H2200_012409 [Cladophialophora chaetospira]|uniref:Uncharacterized protein n=1 Tax=Cladophialophora chaetospira TaxID=386627 RepID=A0AA38WXU2_9EURO|nr:hypothetical protein H2200_012409 [Cladophialophora chaetospira]
MPSLKDLTCHVQWADTGSPFPEYGTVYGDGLVETYIAIPSHPQVFNISLTSRMFISEGLAMVVFIDGQYQCNRNRVNLQEEKGDVPTKKSTINFLLRQKEKPLGDGTYMGREWRFDDCNLGRSSSIWHGFIAYNPRIVTQRPQGTDESHFYHLGEIEVLVLRCRAKHTHERATLTSSSGEHSAVLDDDESSDKSGSVAGKQSDKAAEPAAEAEDMMGMFGLFDGPSDEPPLRRYSGDAPGDDYYRYWPPPHTRPPARYGPQQGPPPSDFRPPFDEAHRSRYSYRDSPPFAGYARPASPPPPPPHPERHVHFDYGNRRRPQYSDRHQSYDRRPQSEWDRNNRPEYSRTRPSSYRESDDRGGYYSYAEYAVPPDQGHYMYDPARRAYVRYPEARQAYDNYRSQSPPPRPHPASHPERDLNSHPPFPAPHVSIPNPPATAPNGPPVPPHNMAMQGPHARYIPPVPAHPISYFIPAPMPQQMAVPPFPGAIPIYPPPGNALLFQTQGPNSGSGQAGPAESGPTGNGQQQWRNNSGNAENNNSGEVRYDNISDQKPAGDNNNGAWGDSGNNTSGNNNTDAWGDSGNTGNNTGNSNNNDWNNDNNNYGGNIERSGADWPTIANENTGNTNNDQQDNDWDQNNNSGNDNGDGGWNDLNSGGNNDTGNNGAGWDNDNNPPAGDSNNQGWANDNSGNQQGGNGAGWTDPNQNNQNSGGGNDQSNNWNQAPNNNPALNQQASNWSNENRQPSGSGSLPTPGGSQSNARVLYGPYGPYYGAKSLAQKGPPPDSEEEPRYDLPRVIAQSRNVTKQVQPGPGYLYVKKRCAPVYIDTLDEPYAKFVFKYRTREQLKHEIGVDISGEPTGDDEVNALENLDRAELIQLVLRAKGALGGAIPEPPARPTPVFMNEFQQIPVPAPDMSYLSYSLPAMRNVSNNAGLGIRYSSSSQGNGGTPNQNNNQQNNYGGSGGDQGWANNNQQQQNNDNWQNDAPNNSGWDGAQERRISMGPAQTYQNSSYPNQGPSRRESGISPGDTSEPHATNFDDAFDAVFSKPAGPPPPPPIIAGPVGTTGGGQTKWGPPPTTSVRNSEGGAEAAAAPKHGW